MKLELQLEGLAPKDAAELVKNSYERLTVATLVSDMEDLTAEALTVELVPVGSEEALAEGEALLKKLEGLSSKSAEELQSLTLRFFGAKNGLSDELYEQSINLAKGLSNSTEFDVLFNGLKQVIAFSSTVKGEA